MEEEPLNILTKGDVEKILILFDDLLGLDLHPSRVEKVIKWLYTPNDKFGVSPIDYIESDWKDRHWTEIMELNEVDIL